MTMERHPPPYVAAKLRFELQHPQEAATSEYMQGYERGYENGFRSGLITIRSEQEKQAVELLKKLGYVFDPHALWSLPPDVPVIGPLPLERESE